MPCLTANARVQGRSPPLAGARRARARARACRGRAAAQLAGCAAQSGRTVQQPGPYSWQATAAVHSSKAARGGVAARPAVVARAAAVEEPVVAEALPAAEGIFIEDVTFDSEHETYTVRGRLESTAPPDLVYAALTDYSSLPRVFHNVLESQELDVGGEKHLVQTCKWAFLIFSGTFRTSLAVTEEPAARRLAFHLVQSSFMKQFVGRWEVQSAPASSASSSAGEGPAVRSVIRHALTVRPSVAPPKAVAHYTSKIFSSQVAAVLRDLQAELHRQLEQQQKT